MSTIDLTRLTAFCKGDRTRMVRYIQAYLEAQPDGLLQLQEKLADRDAEGLALVAHSLRPQTAFMGADTLLEQLAAVEELARTEGPEACAAPLAAIGVLQAEVMSELRAYLDEPPA